MSRMRINEREVEDADILRTVLFNFPDMIHSVDDNGQIVYANRASERMLGYTVEELMEMNVRQIYADEILPEVEKGFASLKRHGEKRVESLLKDRNGVRIPVEIRSFSIYDDEGNFLHTFSILRDLRNIKELQQSLIHASRLAAIGELASGVAHDVNNPLMVIQMSNQMLADVLADCMQKGARADDLNELAELSDSIKKASETIQKITDHLRSFSRKVGQQYTVIDMKQVLMDSLFICSYRISNSSVVVDDQTGNGPYPAIGSANQMEQVVVNLISNACDAMAEQAGEKRMTLAVSSVERDGSLYWRCDVRDTGPGIPDDVRDRIFESFFTTKPDGKGTGLGLSIARGIVRHHKGMLEMETEQGKGTTFSLYIQQHEVQASA